VMGLDRCAAELIFLLGLLHGFGEAQAVVAGRDPVEDGCGCGAVCRDVAGAEHHGSSVQDGWLRWVSLILAV